MSEPANPTDARRSAPGGLVVFRRTDGPGEIDAIDEYSRRMTAALVAQGVTAEYEWQGLSAVLRRRTQPEWVLLQYNPFRHGRSGFAPGLVRDAWRLRRRGVRLVVMVHEAWVDVVDLRTMLVGLWQRLQLRSLLCLCDAMMASTESVTQELGQRAAHVPVGSNITPAAVSREEARNGLGLNGELTVGLFGRDHESRALDHAEVAIAALVEARGVEQITVMNLGADAPPIEVPAGVRLHCPRRIDEESLSLRLLAADLILLPFSDGVSTKRSTMMAALAHGTAVAGVAGRRTDRLLSEAASAVSLTPVGDLPAYARSAVVLADDAVRRKALAANGRELYASRFDWPVTARRVAAVIDAAAPRHATDVVFVACEVGGPGGMERQSEQLVRRLLAAGRTVTVIARSCAVPAHPRLRFVRVPTPTRPFTLAFPAFVLVASLLAARHRGAVLHTTGAIVANRVDLATVHYCHRVAARRVDGSRASRRALPYRLNARLAAIMSRRAESWCYRPARTGLLCAVSDGGARELREEFPAMGQSVRAIPNGVDASLFRPDQAARAEVRSDLGIGDDEPVALFVGGDWERKGLPHAVDALEAAHGWHLVVAGSGDPEPLIARARDQRSGDRLHFLGRVSDTARIYAAADAFVLPTSYEAFPLVVLEAAATGLPVLVTHVNGVGAVVEHGVTGLFIERTSASVAAALRKLSGDREAAREIGAAARRTACRYTWDAMALAYDALYRERERD